MDWNGYDSTGAERPLGIWSVPPTYRPTWWQRVRDGLRQWWNTPDGPDGWV